MAKSSLLDIALHLYDQGFNVTTATIFKIKNEETGKIEEKKQPYCPTRKNPKKWPDKNPLTRDEIKQCLKKIQKVGMTPLIGFFPGEITRGKYKGFFTFGIDFDDSKNIEILGLNNENCIKAGVYFERSRTKGHHIYGITDKQVDSVKYHEVGLEYFGSSGFIMVYNNFESELGELKPQIDIDVKIAKFKARFEEVKGIKTDGPPINVITQRVQNDPLCVQEALKGLKQGSRNEGALALAFWYKNVKKLKKEETNAILKMFAEKCKPPLTEYRTVVDSVYKDSYKDKSTGCTKWKQLGLCSNEATCQFKARPSFEIDVTDGKKVKVTLYGKNFFELTNAGHVVVPKTKSNSVLWYESEYYRRMITNSIIEEYRMKKDEAQRITIKICKQAQELKGPVTRMEDQKDMPTKEEEEALNKIKKTVVVRSEDSNTYEIHMEGDEVIRLTDEQLYYGPTPFGVQYLNRFLKRVVISKEHWHTFFIPVILDPLTLEADNSRLESKADIVIEKLQKFLKNKRVYDWTDIKARAGYQNHLFFDIERNEVLVSTYLKSHFFEKEKLKESLK